jgi:hypothetical protein
MELLERNYLDKHDALNHTARALTEHGLSFIAARNLHHEEAEEAAPAAALLALRDEARRTGTVETNR